MEFNTAYVRNDYRTIFLITIQFNQMVGFGVKSGST